MNIIVYSQYAAYAAIFLGFALVLSRSLNWRASSKFDVSKAIASGNTALGFRRMGAQIALAIAMLGVFLGKAKPDFLNDIYHSLGYGALAIVFIWISLLVIDKVILPHIDNNEEIKNGNIAVGVVELGALVMTGILAFASIYGDSGTWLSSLGYFVLGQVTVILLVYLFEWLTNSNLLDNIKDGKVASGVYLASKTIAYGLILMGAIKGNGGSSDILQSLIQFGVVAGIGIVFLYIAELLIDKLIITETTVHEILESDNVAAALQLSSIKVGMALILGVAIL
jgi:uncharacterized membrane protein YjfL (UPF0719 family)